MSSKAQRKGVPLKQTAKGDTNNKPIGRKSLLVDYVGKQVTVITNDGRNVVGCMKGFDQVCNIILEKCAERVFSVDQGVSVISLGLYVIRGDNIAVVGELDPEKDSNMAWNNVYVRARNTSFYSGVSTSMLTTSNEIFFDAQGHTIKPVVH